MKERRATVASVREIANAVFEVDLSLDEELAFRPGMFLSIRMPGHSIGERRSYSIVEVAGRTLTLLLRVAGGGAQTITDQPVGTELSFFGPMGFFALRDEHAGPAIFAATGVGISALYPMMRQLVEGGQDVQLHWGLERRADDFWDDRMDALALSGRFAIHRRYAAEGEGFITDAVVACGSSVPNATFYLCGNPYMVRAVIEGLEGAAVPKERLVYEAFGAAF